MKPDEINVGCHTFGLSCKELRVDGFVSDLEGESTTLSRARSGDLAAFGEFFDEHAAGVLRFFQLRTAENEVAADLCSETFAGALEALPTYDSTLGTPRMWLYGIARKKFAVWIRQEEVERAARDRVGFATETVHVDDLDLVELRADLTELVGVLEAAMSLLTDGAREAVMLRIVGEHSYRIVAQRLGCDERTARVRVSRGLDQLLRHIDPEARP